MEREVFFGGGGLLHLAPVPFLCCFLGVGVRGRTMGRKMVPNQPLNGNTVGGSGSFKAGPGYIVLPDRRRRMEFAGGCQKVSILCERLNPLFTALYRAQAPFVLLLLSPLARTFSHFGAPDLRPTVSAQSAATPPLRAQARTASRNTRLSPATFPSFPSDPALLPAPVRKGPLNDAAQKQQQGRNPRHKGGLMGRERGNCHSACAFLLNHLSHTIKSSESEPGTFTREPLKRNQQEVEKLPGM